MELINQNPQTGGFSARGMCPHCSLPSLHMFVVGPHIKPTSGTNGPESNVLVQCQNCQAVTFIIGHRNNQHSPLYVYKESFPIGNPEASVDKAITTGVRADFVEAQRCRSVNAYKATVVMCRRALQASCQDLKAAGYRLIDQIDDLAAKGKITTALKGMAHDVRKLGNEGAHPDEDGLGDVTEEDADDIVEFTRQYFEHVYVMPARSESFRKRREAATAKTNSTDSASAASKT
jgi:Domain of unknown function (DUF4145)